VHKQHHVRATQITATAHRSIHALPGIFCPLSFTLLSLCIIRRPGRPGSENVALIAKNYYRCVGRLWDQYIYSPSAQLFSRFMHAYSFCPCTFCCFSLIYIYNSVISSKSFSFCFITRPPYDFFSMAILHDLIRYIYTFNLIRVKSFCSIPKSP
jgi:hypothetical protein